jgi:ribosome maturation factor RimP
VPLFLQRKYEGSETPLFLYSMEFKNLVSSLVEESLTERKHLFLIDLKVAENKKIVVILDGDNGVTLQDCIDVSRDIEHNLDREEYDFALEVSSAGLSSPLKLIRQYKKNIGKELDVETQQEKIRGVLQDANDEFITLIWTAREPKKVGKGKETVEKQKEINYSDIIEATIALTF